MISPTSTITVAPKYFDKDGILINPGDKIGFSFGHRKSERYIGKAVFEDGLFFIKSKNRIRQFFHSDRENLKIVTKTLSKCNEITLNEVKQ